MLQCDEYLFTEFKRLWSTSVLGWVTALVHYPVYDGFAASDSRPKPLSALFVLAPVCGSILFIHKITINCKNK